MTQDIEALLVELEALGEHPVHAESLAARAAAIRESQREGYIVAMRLMQSNEVLDDAEVAARDYFLTKANIANAVKG